MLNIFLFRKAHSAHLCGKMKTQDSNVINRGNTAIISKLVAKGDKGECLLYISISSTLFPSYTTFFTSACVSSTHKKDETSFDIHALG